MIKRRKLTSEEQELERVFAEAGKMAKEYIRANKRIDPDLGTGIDIFRKSQHNYSL